MENYEISAPSFYKTEINIPSKRLLSAGPTNCSEKVLKVMSKPILGHLHPETLKIMDDVKDGIRYVFQTNNKLTFCVSGSAHSGMETVLVNLLEDGDVIVIGVTGLWGNRAADMARRYGADIRLLTAAEGSVLTADDIQKAMETHRPVALFIIQGDSSTGIHQPLHEFGEICRKYNCLYIVDSVASLCGVDMQMDKWQIDALYTGSQKVIGAPPGITPVSFSPKAVQKMVGRNTKIKVYYFDAFLLGDYWNCFGRPRIYHHTICSTLLAALREALASICEQGIKSVIKRHKDCALRLYEGLEALGLKFYVEEKENRLPTITSVRVPDKFDWTRLCSYAMHNYSLEIGGGLGPTAGLAWRIGLMGENATFENVDFILKVIKEVLPK